MASGNFTLGEIADYVDAALREHLGVQAQIQIRHLDDIRNYKVDFTKAQKVLGFRPAQSIQRIVRELIDRRAEFGDMDDPRYSNIASLKAMDAAAGSPA